MGKLPDLLSKMSLSFSSEDRVPYFNATMRPNSIVLLKAKVNLTDTCTRDAQHRRLRDHWAFLLVDRQLIQKDLLNDSAKLCNQQCEPSELYFFSSVAFPGVALSLADVSTWQGTNFLFIPSLIF